MDAAKSRRNQVAPRATCNDRKLIFRDLPQVQRLLQMDRTQALCLQYGRLAVTRVLREVLADVRSGITDGAVAHAAGADALVEETAQRLAKSRRLGLRRVINATGIVLHTNLGRAPLAAEAIAAVEEAARSYCNVEFDLATGKRGSRTQSVESLLRTLTGAEASLAVNNGAAAILLALSALAADAEVIVSRGELVEIGGGFRIPDVIRQGGARLVEVGATNKTRLSDYRDAIGPATRVLLKVHQSNFRAVGFTGQASIAELSSLARERGLLVVADLGSGLMTGMHAASEPTIADAMADGADVVTCSGDKLLGGPQAGLILGRPAALERLRKHPLLRAVRLDKMSLAALEATLMLHRDAPQRIPVLRMIGQGEDALRARAERLLQLVGDGRVESSEGFAGGGSLPEERMRSFGLSLPTPKGADETAALLRSGSPAVVCRFKDGRLLADILAVSDEELPELADRLRAMLA